MALSEATVRLQRNAGSKKYHDYEVGTGATIYTGSLVCVDTSTGRAVAATDAASRKFLGVAAETKTGDTGGTVRCRVEWNVEAKVTAATALTQAYIGSNVAVSDDDAVTTVSDSSNSVRVGELVSITGTNAWVALRNFSESDV